MSVAGIKLDIDAAELRALRDEIRRLFPAKQAARVIAPIVRKAIQPFVTNLRYITPVGPTGNLRRSVTSKVVTYPGSGVVVGVVGFTRAGRAEATSAAGGTVRAGKDRAFHQWWLEFGTRERKITRPIARVYARRSPTRPFARYRAGHWEEVAGRGVLHTVQEREPTYIASSFNRLGPFKIVRQVGRDGRVETNPAYPNAFFRKSKTPIVIPEMPAGGTTGQPPLQTAWMNTQPIVAEILQRELRLSIEQAWAAMQFRVTGTANSTDTF